MHQPPSEKHANITLNNIEAIHSLHTARRDTQNKVKNQQRSLAELFKTYTVYTTMV